MTDSTPAPFFQGNLDQVRELQALCAEHGLHAEPMQPPGGSGNS